MIAFNIATVERRKPIFLEILKSLAAQTIKCDVINVAMNYKAEDKEITDFLAANFKSYNIRLKENLKAEYKMFALDTLPYDCYFLTFDDDILYPADYAEKLIHGIEWSGRKEVVGFHGIRFDSFPVTEYKKQKTMFQYFKDVEHSVSVHVIGTGCMGFYMGTVLNKRLIFSNVNSRMNCLDGSFGRWCRDNSIPMKVLAHQAGWMQIYPQSQDNEALWVKSSREKYRTKLSFLQK